MTLEQAAMKLGNTNQVSEMISPNILPHLNDDDSKRLFAARIVGSASILAFQELGWKIRNPIGQSPYVEPASDSNHSSIKDELSEDLIANQTNQKVMPFEWIEQLLAKKCTLEELLENYRQFGVGSVRIGDLVKALPKS